MYCSNLYVRHIFEEEMKRDTSFQEKDNILSRIFCPTRYSDRDMRETWDKGIMLGIEIGLRRASLEGQRIELERNICTEREKEFVKKLYQLCGEYNCAIQYHPEHGMTLVALREYLP